MITLNIQEIIRFYDGQDRHISGHVSSITGLIGEDLAAGLIKHYFDSKNQPCNILSGHPTEGRKKGKWLDRWLLVEETPKKRILYQTEIKNWCSHSIGGRRLDLNATPDEINEYALQRFDEQWDREKSTFRYDYVSKVLKAMVRPVNHQNIEIRPLICYWYPIKSPNMITLEEFFKIPCESDIFKEVHFFSMSLYLRKLLLNNKDRINIEAQNIESRLSLINDLFR